MTKQLLAVFDELMAQTTDYFVKSEALSTKAVAYLKACDALKSAIEATAYIEDVHQETKTEFTRFINREQERMDVSK